MWHWGRWKSVFFPFASLIKSDDDKIDEIRAYPAFAEFVTYHGMNRKEIDKLKNERWGTHNLLATSEEHGEAKAIDSQMRVLCYQASKGIPSEYERLYNDVALSEIYRIIAIDKAVKY